MKSKIVDFIATHAVVWKIPVASAFAWEIAEFAGSKHPYLSPLTVILSIQATVGKSVQFAWQRILGTIAGVLFTASIAPYVGLSGWSIGLLLFASAVIVAWMKWDHAVMIQVALSILLVMYFQSKMPSYPFDRIRDTITGAFVAVLFQLFIFPPDSVQQAKKKMSQFADHLTDHFYRTAQWVKGGCSSNEARLMTTQLQTLFQELHKTTTELEKAGQSLNYNPLAHKKRHTLHDLNHKLELLRQGFANLSDMIRVFTKWSESSLFTHEDQRVWTGHLNNLAAYVKEWRGLLEAPKTSAYDPHAVGLQIKAPHPMDKEQYPLALYMNAEQIIQDFKNPVFSSNNA
ncbi:aromatic acid exporter family protein [Paenibacillus allorhizosphaerae]|uniref:Integral membrane bound transporter domain-containing protein n=1 Tax=Paenibacillus allorhizosphaerae TaxID=2849866 RepID=A0ABM8VAS5_9BACL|nr:FUSC family protein [Paenibacillus allorhizosphaerae]CAG7615858.1 hypothetical protein PAECIP111802_00219 [Paenibacillus allorhizosphaerae]